MPDWNTQEWLTFASIVVVALVPAASAGWRLFSDYRRKPIVIVHYWWERVIAWEKLRLSPFVVVGVRWPIGDDWRKKEALRNYRWELDQVLDRESKDKDEVSSLLINPIFRLCSGPLDADSIDVLRVVIHNQSKRRIVTEDMFGELRFDLDTRAGAHHGWRKGVLGASIKELSDVHGVDPPRQDAIEISLPHPLNPKESIRDDFTVSLRMSHEFAPESHAYRHRVEVRTTSEMRIRVKPWQPSQSRSPWNWPSRGARWVLRAYRPSLYAPREAR